MVTAHPELFSAFVGAGQVAEDLREARHSRVKTSEAMKELRKSAQPIRRATGAESSSLSPEMIPA
jgi:hypothetical protein